MCRSGGRDRLPPYSLSMALGHAGTKGAAASDVHYVLSKRPGEYRLWLERWAGHVEGGVATAKASEFPAKSGA